MSAVLSSAPCLIAPGESRTLAGALAAETALPLIPLEERRFEGGELKLRPLESVRGRAVFVLESLAGTGEAPVCERLVRLLFLLQGLRDAGALTTIAVLPYLAFARKDRRTQLRDPVTSRYVAELLETTGVAQVVCLDVHNPAAFDNAFRVPTVHLTALPMMVEHFARQAPAAGFAVVSPDVGGIKRAQIFRELLAARTASEVELAFLEKRRAKGVVATGLLAGEIAGRAVIVLDDLCATGGTLIRAAQACHRAGARSVAAAVTHTPLAAGLEALLAADAVSAIVATDSVGIDFSATQTSAASDKLVTLPVAPLIAQAIVRMIAGRPIAELLERWPPR
ncbi:MAG: ribose-phosphate pyrophosphokinase [Proteobacteria bacterium]|nr:ribose-phosphate pyrophosphokinase [Pseudomonadota bacterium]